MDITKTDFEQTLMVATSSQLQVYNKVEPAITDAIYRVETDVLGTIGTAALDTHARLLTIAKRYACLDALLSVFRQLDLVLTPTGFGVVSNQTTAPASKERVNALYEELTLSFERTAGELLLLLTVVEGWGASHQGIANLRTVVFDIGGAERRLGRKLTLSEWLDIVRVSFAEDTRLRQLVGHGQMDALMSGLRSCSCTNEELTAVELMRDLTFLALDKSPAIRERERNLLKYMEANADTFSVYMASDEYKANHYERFQNNQDNPAYCCVG